MASRVTPFRTSQLLRVTKVGKMSDVELMGLALQQATRGLEAGAMPIGAVLTHAARCSPKHTGEVRARGFSLILNTSC